MLILSPVFVSLLQSQIIAFAVQCRSFTPSLWTERPLNKSQNRQFTIITMYQVTFNPNSSRRTSLLWGRWLTGINTPLFTSYIRCFPPQWKCNFPRKTAGINNHIAMLKYDKINVTDMVHNRTNRQNIRNPTFFCRIIRLATNNAFRRREQHKALSDSLAFEIDPIQRLLNGQIGAPRRGANNR